MEKLDIYTINKVKTGKIINREDELLEGEYIFVVEIFVINSNNELLITQRHPNKKQGLKWECSGGAVIAGEDSQTGAKRELYEETGIKADQLKFINSEVSDYLIIDSYIYEYDFDVNDIKLQESETINKNKVNFSELKELYEHNQFVKYQYKRIMRLFGNKM